MSTAEYLPVSIDGTSFMVDVEGYSRTTIPVLREQRDTSDEAGEQQLNTQMWIRSQTDWSYGAGQPFLDNADSDRRRFYTSSGVDVWTKGEVSLLPKTVDKGNTGDDVIMKVFVSNDVNYMYVASGTDLYYSTDFDAASPTWTAVTALASPLTIVDFTSDGSTVFIAYGAAAKPHTTAIGTTTQPSPLTGHSARPDVLRFVSGRLIEADANHIAELAANGQPISGSLDFEGIEHALSWVDMCAGPTGVYAAANTDDIGSIFFCSTGTDGLLNQPAQVADLPRGETINAIESYGGLLIMATSKGLRVAVMNQDGSVSYGPVVDNGGAAHSLATDDRFVWFGTASGQVYRADLSVFTDTLVPAWATDVVSVEASPGNVTWVARVDGKTYFVDAANGVQGERHDGERVESGTLNVGSVRWNSLFDKVLQTIKADLRATLATTGATSYDQSGTTYDDSDYIYNGLLSAVSGTLKVRFVTGAGVGLTTLTLNDRAAANIDYSLSDKYDVIFTLERDAANNTVGPVLESWQLQAFPAPTRIDEIVLPLVLRQRVATSRGHGAALTQDPRALYEAIRTLMIAKTVVPYKEGSYSDDVIVDQVQFSADRLADDADWWEGTMTVRLLTLP
ncbi:MAG: hypothetical protein VW982_07670 [Candidatus Poseidoniales archaeon]